METNKEERKEILEKITALYDNMYEGTSSPINYDNEGTVMDDMFLSNLRSNIPHVIFADMGVSRDTKGNIINKMFFHAMSLDTLQYYLKDPNAIFTNWVINDASSEFTQIYTTRLLDTSFKPIKGKSITGLNITSDILGGPFLHMANLDVGKGGTHGNRRFFQLQLRNGKKLIDAQSALQLYHVDKSEIFILRPRMMPGSTSSMDITRSGGLYSNTSTISGTHGQAPETIIYELVPFKSSSYKAIFNRNGDEIFDTVSGKGNRGHTDIIKLAEYIVEKHEFERKDDGDEHQSYIEEIRLKDLATGTIPAEELLKMTMQERDDIQTELKVLKHNIDQLVEGKFIDTEEDKTPLNNRLTDFDYIFSKENTKGTIPIDFVYYKDKDIDGKGFSADIALDHIPKDSSIFWQHQYTHKYIIFILENEEGIEKTICGKVIGVFSNLNGYVEVEDGISDGFHPNKGQWIYHINFKIGSDTNRSILMGEKRLDNSSEDGSIKIIEQISLDEPKVLKKTIIKDGDTPMTLDELSTNDFRMQLVTKEQALAACESVSGLSNDTIKPADFLDFQAFDTEDFEMLLPVGRIIGDMDTRDSPLSIDQSMSLINSMENSFLENEDEDIMDAVRNFDPHPPQNISQEIIEESPTNSPLRIPRTAQLSRQLERGLPNPTANLFPGLFPGLFPEEMSYSEEPFISPSAQALANLRSDIDSEEEVSIHSPPYAPGSPTGDDSDSSSSDDSDSSSSDAYDSDADINELFNLPPIRRRLNIVNDNDDQPPRPPISSRLDELNRAQTVARSLRRRIRDPLGNDPNPSVLQSPRRGIDSIGLNPDGSYIEPIAPASPLFTRNSNSPGVVPETPPERMGDPSYYREQDEKRRKEEAEED